MKIVIKDGKAHVYTPYNKTFVSELKSRVGGAKWNGSAWVVSEDSVDDVRAIMREVYGETDQVEGNRVDVRVTITKDIAEDCGPVVIFGRTVASAYGRDSGVKVGDNVVFLDGKATSGGSKKNWYTSVPSGCVIEIRNVPESIVVEGEQNYGEHDWDGKFKAEIVKNRIDREALEQEKARLLARIAEIDALLGN